jgi:predicted choloylglycine hydrolase
LILRYLLEFCATAQEAGEVLRRVPTHMAYNITVLDAQGDFVTAYLSPGRTPVLRRWPIATNHQLKVEWQEYHRATSSQARETFLAERLGDPLETSAALADRFLEPPLFNERYDKALGTLYTAIYSPSRQEVEYRWRGKSMRQSFRNFTPQELRLEFGD